MTHTPYDTQENAAVGAPIKSGPSLLLALTFAVLGAVIAVASTIIVIKNNYSTGIEALLAAVSLLAFGGTAYGLIQAVLALVDNAGERRTRDRDVTERRHGERARKPKVQ